MFPWSMFSKVARTVFASCFKVIWGSVAIRSRGEFNIAKAWSQKSWRVGVDFGLPGVPDWVGYWRRDLLELAAKHLIPPRAEIPLGLKLDHPILQSHRKYQSYTLPKYLRSGAICVWFGLSSWAGTGRFFFRMVGPRCPSVAIRSGGTFR